MIERTEEVNDIIERMPVRWTVWVLLLLCIIILTFVSLSVIVKYPDTVSGTITITMEHAPVRLVSHNSGQLHLLIDNMTEVKSGDCIAYIDNGVDYDDIVKIDSICHCPFNEKKQIELSQNMRLGSLTSSYNNFVSAYNSYDMIRKTKVYNNMRTALFNKQNSGKKILENLNEEIRLSEQVLINHKHKIQTDSIMYLAGALSEEELSSNFSNFMSQERNHLELYSTTLKNRFDLSNIDIELAKVDINEYEALKTSYNTLITNMNMLMNEMELWKERYLFIAPISGELEYLDFLRNNLFVQSDQELFSILPKNNNVVGEIEINSPGVGKVKLGDIVNVKLNDYPYEEFGLIEGRVEYISTLTHESRSNGYFLNSHLVKVSFPNGLRTNYNKIIDAKHEYKGNASIVTSKRRLIQRLFDNLKAKENK